MANSKPVNKNNPKNIYCAHCRYWELWGNTYYCGCQDSKHAKQERNYWNRCKRFEWRTEDEV